MYVYILSQNTDANLNTKTKHPAQGNDVFSIQVLNTHPKHPAQGNDVFSCMLGKPMVYTCGIFHEMPKFAADGHKVVLM